MICEIFFNSASSLYRIILVLEVFYDLHYCIIGREVQEVITFSVVPNFSSEETFDFLSGFEAAVFGNHQTCLV